MGKVVRHVDWCQRRLVELLFGDRIYFPAKQWEIGPMEVHEQNCISLLVVYWKLYLLWPIHMSLLVGGGFHLRISWTNTKMRLPWQTWSIVRLQMDFGSPTLISLTERRPSNHLIYILFIIYIYVYIRYNFRIKKLLTGSPNTYIYIYIPSHHSECRSIESIGVTNPKKRRIVMQRSIRLPPGGQEVWMVALLRL